METFTWIVLGITVSCIVGIAIWMVLASRKSDEEYDKAIAEIYYGKRK